MAFQPHVDDDVTVMLVIVGDVEHQRGASDGIAWPHANTRPNPHRLSEVGVGGRCVDSVAVGERIVQRLNKRGLVSDLLVVGRRW